MHLFGSVCLCMHPCMYVPMYIRPDSCPHVSRTHRYFRANTCIYVPLRLMCSDTHTHTHTHTHIYIYIYIYILTGTHTLVHMHTVHYMLRHTHTRTRTYSRTNSYRKSHTGRYTKAVDIFTLHCFAHYFTENTTETGVEYCGHVHGTLTHTLPAHTRAHVFSD
jgi:hypothetical protein